MGGPLGAKAASTQTGPSANQVPARSESAWPALVAAEPLGECGRAGTRAATSTGTSGSGARNSIGTNTSCSGFA